MKELLEAAAKPLWKEIRDLALKKGTETFVSEAVKSVIEVARRRWIRRDEFEFAEWKKTQTADKSAEDAESDADSKKTEDRQSNGDEPDEAPEADASKPPPHDPPEPNPNPPEES